MTALRFLTQQIAHGERRQLELALSMLTQESGMLELLAICTIGMLLLTQGYLDRLGQKTGYMVLFEKKSVLELSWEDRIRREVHVVDNKEIIFYAM